MNRDTGDGARSDESHDSTRQHDPAETALLAEAALSADWNRPEEDAAWSHLQSGLLALVNTPLSEARSG